MRLILGSHSAVGIADIETGAVTRFGELVMPTFVAVSSDRRHRYAVSEDPDGPGSVVTFDESGPIASRPSGGDGPCHLSLHPSGRHLLVSHYAGGSLAVLPVAPDGIPGEVSCVVRHSGGGPDPARQDGPHVHQAVTDPSGNWVLACDLGTDEVVVYRLDDGRLRHHSTADFSPGHGVRHLAFAPGGGRVYVAAELSSQLVACDWDPVTGTLSVSESIETTDPTAPRNQSGATTAPNNPYTTAPRNYPGAVVVSPSGDHVYVTNRGDDSIAVVDADSFKLVTTVASGGAWPRDACLSPDGRYLFAANERSGTVTGFDVTGGIPKPTGTTIDFPAVTSLTPA
ncbi:MAG: lactonase family protein [Stackebrandtia sp.]